MPYVDLTLTDCWCGIPFSMPTRLYEECRKSGETFYCPRGHRIVFKESLADKYRRETERLKQRLAEKDDQIHYERRKADRERRRASAIQGHLTKAKTRIAGGACPCCKRHFTNLERHMKTKHPNYMSEEPPELKIVEGGKS